MLSNNKCILVYNVPEKEIENLKNDGLKLIKVTNEMTNMKILEILNGLRFETVNEVLTKEAVILFNDFSDEEIKSCISVIRKRYKDGILAVVTSNSVEWRFSYLVEHLIEERNWYLKNQKGRA